MDFVASVCMTSHIHWGLKTRCAFTRCYQQIKAPPCCISSLPARHISYQIMESQLELFSMGIIQNAQKWKKYITMVSSYPVIYNLLVNVYIITK